MKANKFFVLFLLTLCMGLMACGGSDDPINPTPKPDTISETDPTPTEMELTAENLAKYVTSNISYYSNEYLYTANIQTSLMSSPLASKVQGKQVKYGMRVLYKTRYTLDGYRNIEAWWNDKKTGGWTLYANGSGNNYLVSVYTPFYFRTTGYNYEKSREENLDEPEVDIVAEAMDYQKTIDYLEELIKQGKATKADIDFYNSIVGIPENARNTTVRYTEGLYTYCTVVAEAFVEISDEVYVIAKKEGPVRIPTYGDIYDF